MVTQTDQLQHKPSLGDGVYTLPEVARYTELHPSRVRAWFKGHYDGLGKGPVFKSDYRPIDSTQAVSFLDLIDVLVAAQFRGFRVSMQRVRAAYTILQKRLETRHPFCHRDLYTDGKQIFIFAANQLGDATLTEIVTNQQFFLHVREHLMRVEYDEADRMARRWRIADGVVIDPAVSFGKPVVAPTGITTFVLANAFQANRQDAELVADLFNVGESDVRNAVEFERCYNRQKAA